jgi:hypothetical protein
LEFQREAPGKARQTNFGDECSTHTTTEILEGKKKIVSSRAPVSGIARYPQAGVNKLFTRPATYFAGDSCARRPTLPKIYATGNRLRDVLNGARRLNGLTSQRRRLIDVSTDLKDDHD